MTEMTLTLTAAQMTALSEGRLTLVVEPEAPAVEDRKVTWRNMEEFGELLGVDLTGWKCADLADSLREYGEVGSLTFGPDEEDVIVLDGMPEGWTFGPATMHYLAEGEFPA